jgi:hypothetical protein
MSVWESPLQSFHLISEYCTPAPLQPNNASGEEKDTGRGVRRLPNKSRGYCVPASRVRRSSRNIPRHISNFRGPCQVARSPVDKGDGAAARPVPLSGPRTGDPSEGAPGPFRLTFHLVRSLPALHPRFYRRFGTSAARRVSGERNLPATCPHTPPRRVTSRSVDVIGLCPDR